MIVTREAKDTDVVMLKEEDQKEGMAITLLIMKRELKICKPQKTVEEKVSQGHTEEGLIKVMLSVTIVKNLGIMLLNVEMPRTMLRGK